MNNAIKAEAKLLEMIHDYTFNTAMEIPRFERI